MSITLTPANAAQIVNGRIRKSYGGVEAKPVASEDRGVVLGIYGPGGVGKTTLAATVADTELGAPALYLDARGNPHVISSYADRIDMLPITQFAQVERIRQDILRDKDFTYKSLILDNVSELFYMDLRDRYGPMTHVEWTKHSATTADILQLVRNWTDLSSTLRVNVIFVFQEVPEARTIRGREVTSRSEVAFNKALQFQVPTLINFLGRLYIDEDTPPYRRLFDLSPVEFLHQAKLQVDPNDEFAKDIPFQVYNPSLASLVDTLRGRKPWPAAKHQRRAPK